MQIPFGNPAQALSSEGGPVGCAGDNASLFFWTDDRTDGAPRSYVVRVDAAGQVLDAPILLPGTVWKNSVQIAWGGDVWLVVYREGEASPRAFGIRVAADGTVLDPTPFSLLNASNLSPPAVASDGTDFLVYFRSSTSYTRRVSSATGALSSLTSYPESALGPARLSWNGSHYLLLTRYAFLEARLLTADGTPASGVLTIGTVPNLLFDTSYAAVATDGTDWMVFFQAVPASGEMTVRRVHDNGTMDPAIIVESAPGVLRRHPQIAYDGANYVLGFLAYDTTAVTWSWRYPWVARDGTPFPGATLTDATTFDSFFMTLSSRGDGAALATYTRTHAPDSHTTAHGRYLTCDACVVPPVPDAGIDAPLLDAGVPDAPTIDAPSPTIDAPSPTIDAPSPTIDAPSPTIDAPSPTEPDAATTPIDPPADGCGCHTSRPGPGLALAGLVLLMSLRRRRRARARSPRVRAGRRAGS